MALQNIGRHTVGGLLAAVSLAVISCEAAKADSLPTPFLTEVRAGAFMHDVESIDGNNSYDLNGEVLFAPLRVRQGRGFFDYFLSPRPHIGGTFSFDDDKTSMGYMGLTWDVPLSDTFFLEFGFGGAVHDGSLDRYGCRANFHEAASFGVNLSESWRLVGTIDHMSNAGLCGGTDNNHGLTNAGLRLGYKFD